jgi:hypothetical protein
MSTPDAIRQPSEEAGQKTAEASLTPASSPAGRFAGIADGRVVAKAQTLAEVVRLLDETGADRRTVEIWEANPDSNKIEYVWSCCRVPPERAGQLPGTPMYPDNPVMQRNEELARKISEEARSDPSSPYAGKFLGIVNGRVTVVADSWDELDRELARLGTNASETIGVEASRDPDAVEEIWIHP